MAAPHQTQAEPGRSGLALPERKAVEAFTKMQEERKPESGEMTGSQAAMRTKPDCGEDSYVGAGKLKDKVVLISGGDSGIGRAASIACGREGANVVVLYHQHEEDARDVCKYIEDAGQRCLVLKCDVSDKTQCFDAVERTVAEFGRIDCVINNAGIQFTEESVEDCLENLDLIFRTNVFSCFYLAAAALKHMKDHSGCTLIQNTSINAFKGNDMLVSYSSTKGAMQALTRSLALKLVSRGIRVNAVAPGPIWTPFITGTDKFNGEAAATFGEKNPMGRAGQPVECSAAFVYLASADSSFVTGNTIHVDGGQYTSS